MQLQFARQQLWRYQISSPPELARHPPLGAKPPAPSTSSTPRPAEEGGAQIESKLIRRQACQRNNLAFISRPPCEAAAIEEGRSVWSLLVHPFLGRVQLGGLSDTSLLSCVALGEIGCHDPYTIHARSMHDHSPKCTILVSRPPFLACDPLRELTLFIILKRTCSRKGWKNNSPLELYLGRGLEGVPASSPYKFAAPVGEGPTAGQQAVLKRIRLALKSAAWQTEAEPSPV